VLIPIQGFPLDSVLRKSIDGRSWDESALLAEFFVDPTFGSMVFGVNWGIDCHFGWSCLESTQRKGSVLICRSK